MPRVLLAADDEDLRSTLQATLERESSMVVAVACVMDELSRITEEQLDLLLSDLHTPHTVDRFTVVSAISHTRSQAVTLLVSGYPALEETSSAIRCAG